MREEQIAPRLPLQPAAVGDGPRTVGSLIEPARLGGGLPTGGETDDGPLSRVGACPETPDDLALPGPGQAHTSLLRVAQSAERALAGTAVFAVAAGAERRSRSCA